MTEGCPSIQDYGGTATIDRKRLTADVARRFRGEEHDPPLDIVVAASAAQRRDLRDLIGPFRQPGRQLRWEIARTLALRLMLCLPHSVASAWVSVISAPLLVL